VTKLFLYVVSASPNPDNVKCLVPYSISHKEIFFGPCKKRLRKKLRDQYLETSNDVNPNESIFVVGVNGSNPEKCRKIIWAGRIIRLMTFEVAYDKLTASKYQQMRIENKSPLHVRPLYNSAGKFKGYEHCSLMHEKDDNWILDFTHSNNRYVRLDGKKLLLTPSASRYQAFPRDCCFLLDNLFFAQGAGIPITSKILDILKEAQPERKDINEYAIFGRRSDGSADGRTGRWLEVTGESAEELVHLIKGNIPAMSGARHITNRRSKSCC
jgi:hypothetical protein